MTLTGLKGTTYTIDPSPIDSSGSIYRMLGGDRMVTKLFRDGAINQELVKKLTDMIENPPSEAVLSQVAWPLDLVGVESGTFCGIVMPELSDDAKLSVEEIPELGAVPKAIAELFVQAPKIAQSSAPAVSQPSSKKSGIETVLALAAIVVVIVATLLVTRDNAAPDFGGFGGFGGGFGDFGGGFGDFGGGFGGEPDIGTLEEVPSELEPAYTLGVWPLAPFTYDPSLDDEAIPSGAVIFGLWDDAFAPLPAPGSIMGFSAVASMAQLTEGTFYAFTATSGFDYVALGTADMGAAAAPPPPMVLIVDAPPELASAFFVGVWPLAPLTYDPGLDAVNIPAGAVIYGLFDLDFNTLPPPDAVAGYVEVADILQLSEGYFYIFTADSGFSYVLLMSAAE